MFVVAIGYYGYTQVVLLDEASQMSEPVSLLPIARFGCHKLLLLGDPKVTYSIYGCDNN